MTAIQYNYLNLPTQVTINGQNILYVYDATGVKLRKTVNSVTTDYAGNFIYENNQLQFFNQPEGYIEPNGNSFTYVYQLKDIWKNVRITFADANGNGSIVQGEIRREQNYYPFGLEHRGYNNALVGAISNFKTYQNQEFTEDLGLNTHEWKYRISDPALGRFWQIDPLAEDYVYNSTYAFQENKLGMGTELEGLEMIGFLPPMSTPLLGISDMVIMSDAGKIIDVGVKASDAIGKTTETITRLSENFSKGKNTEIDELTKSGLEKNIQKFTRVDPKTGKDGTTIPDAMKPNGGTKEIKNVKKQSLTKQLRLQREVSNDNGVKPELTINNTAKLSNPLLNGGFDITTYQVLSLVMKKDNTSIKLKEIVPLKNNP